MEGWKVYTHKKVARNTKVSGKLNEGTKESMRMGIKMERTKEVKYWGSGRQERRKETDRLKWKAHVGIICKHRR